MEPVQRPTRTETHGLQTPIAAGLIVAAAATAYANSFSGPFVFDDGAAIVENYSIRHLASALQGAADSTAGGRPILNLSLAASYALSGLNVWGYHLLNLLIHAAAGLALFGILRRTFERLRSEPGLSGSPPAPTGSLVPAIAGDGSSSHEYQDLGLPLGLRRGRQCSPTLLALCIALLWTVHPLQTESVTYVVQRAESLAGLFYLLTLYCFIRSVEADGATKAWRPTSPRLRRASLALPDRSGSSQAFVALIWAVLSIVACLLGMATKEVMVTAPVMVLLYDRTFIAGSFAAAWRSRRLYYAALASTWFLLGFLIAGTGGNRGGSIGFGIGIPWWEYALTQFRAVATYLCLSVWPHSLAFDREPQWVSSAMDVIPYALVVLPLLGATGWLTYRRRALGFVGAWFFVILAPTSSVVPGVSQLIVEHRMYLPLAAVITAIALGVHFIGGGRGVALLAAWAVPLALATHLRNETYRSAIALWRDTTEKRPLNPFAHTNLGVALGQSGDRAGALAEYALSLRLLPTSVETHTDMAMALMDAGRSEEALAQFHEALRLKPGYTAAHVELGGALIQLGRLPEGIAQYQEALRLEPGNVEAHNNLGAALAQSGRLAEAEAHYLAVLRVDPDYASAHFDYGNALAQTGRFGEAIGQFREALRLKPVYAEAHVNLGNVFLQTGKFPEAISEYREALRIGPDSVLARINLGRACLRAGRAGEAMTEFEAALRLQPDNAEAHQRLGVALAEAGRPADGIAQLREALRLQPGYADAHQNLGVVLLHEHQEAEAAAELHEAERLREVSSRQPP